METSKASLPRQGSTQTKSTRRKPLDPAKSILNLNLNRKMYEVKTTHTQKTRHNFWKKTKTRMPRYYYSIMLPCLCRVVWGQPHQQSYLFPTSVLKVQGPTPGIVNKSGFPESQPSLLQLPNPSASYYAVSEASLPHPSRQQPASPGRSGSRLLLNNRKPPKP